MLVQARRRGHDGYLDRRGECDGDWLALIKLHRDSHIGTKKLLVCAHGFRRKTDLLEGVGIHEEKGVTIGVQIFHLLVIKRDLFELVARV
ncbi:hypothetical protein D9M72_395030 [compost metagenome]